MIPVRLLEMYFIPGIVFGVQHNNFPYHCTSIHLGLMVININWGKSWTGY